METKRNHKPPPEKKRDEIILATDDMGRGDSSLFENMKKEQLQKKQEELDEEVLKCKCGKDTTWSDVRDYGVCLDCASGWGGIKKPKSD